jgi:hypothetical protein
MVFFHKPFTSDFLISSVLGEVKLTALVRGQKERICYKLRATKAAHAVNFGMHQADSGWYKCKYAVSESLDQCFVGSWVFGKSDVDKASCFSWLNLHQLISLLQTSTISWRISDIL